jgi:hypothetical protein
VRARGAAVRVDVERRTRGVPSGVLARAASCRTTRARTRAGGFAWDGGHNTRQLLVCFAGRDFPSRRLVSS